MNRQALEILKAKSLSEHAACRFAEVSRRVANFKLTQPAKDQTLIGLDFIDVAAENLVTDIRIPGAPAPNSAWTRYFVHDSLSNGGASLRIHLDGLRIVTCRMDLPSSSLAASERAAWRPFVRLLVVAEIAAKQALATSVRYFS